jgi:hypothetical protein
MRFLKLFLAPSLLLLLLQSSSCKVKYDFSGGRKFDDSVTVSILMFTNSATLTKATFPQTISEAMRDAIQRQTRLISIANKGDLNYEGTITGYAVAPVAIQGGGNNEATVNRLSVTVNVKYTDSVDEKYNFESLFTRFSDFQSSQNLSAVEDQLLKEIADQLVQDIMNKSINAW